MVLPAYWWLLALVIVFQGAFFIRIGVLRMHRKKVQPLARPATAMLFASGAAGLVYGLVQSDPLFFLGQTCLLFIYHVLRKKNDDGTE